MGRTLVRQIERGDPRAKSLDIVEEQRRRLMQPESRTPDVSPEMPRDPPENGTWVRTKDCPLFFAARASIPAKSSQRLCRAQEKRTDMMPTPSGVLESEGHTVIASGLAAATGSASLEATLSSRRRYALPESVSGSVSMRIPAPIPIAKPITTPVRWNLLQGLPECHRTSAGPGAARFAVVAHRSALAPADVPS